MNAVTYIPEDYQDLYETYFDPAKDSFVRGLTRRYAGAGARTADVEDLMHATFERMLRLKGLEKFDEERGNFGLYLQQIIRSVCFTWHDKNKRTPTFAACILEALPDGFSGEHSGNPGHTRGGRRMAGVVAEDSSPEEDHEGVELAERLFAIAEAEKKKEGGKRAEGLETMISILVQGGEAKEVAETLGVSPSTVTHWRQYLRDQVSA